MRKILFALLTVSVCNIAVSQDINFGVKGGVNFASLTGDTSGLETRTAFHFGIVAEVQISDKFAFQPELLYSSQGAKDSEFDEELKTNYLNIPLMAKYYVAENISIEAGPQIGLLLSAKTEIDGADDEDIKFRFRDVDFGFNFGLGYKLGSGLNFGLRYNLGISNIVNEVEAFVTDNKINNSVFQISIGYLF